MRALVQRVARASVTVDDVITAQIGKGLVILLGVTKADTAYDAEKLADKVTRLRIFPDSNRKMNFSVLDISGELLVVSQFTLYADTRRGNRPSYSDAARPELAEPLYQHFVESCRRAGIVVKTGQFQAYMNVELVNEGPVTILCENK